MGNVTPVFVSKARRSVYGVVVLFLARLAIPGNTWRFTCLSVIDISYASFVNARYKRAVCKIARNKNTSKFETITLCLKLLHCIHYNIWRLMWPLRLSPKWSVWSYLIVHSITQTSFIETNVVKMTALSLALTVHIIIHSKYIISRTTPTQHR